jgi:uncharacterized protein (TIGR02391 family)
MTASKTGEPAASEIAAKLFTTTEQIDWAIAKLKRRIAELEQIDIGVAVLGHNGADAVAEQSLRSTILEIYGPRSPEYQEHKHIKMWAGPMFVNMNAGALIEGKIKGRTQIITILNGLIARLQEKREDLKADDAWDSSIQFEKLNLHPRIAEATRDLFLDGHHFEAVFAGAKVLVNFVKERSGRFDLDGAPLVRAVFSKNNPVLSFNNLAEQTDLDQQEGLMHLFEGAVLAIRNPGGHSFPGGTEQRAIEYITLLSLLAHLTQEATKRPFAT